MFPFTPKAFKLLGDILNLKVVEINYVFSFLLGLRFQSSLFHKILNILPFPLGSNIIGVFKKTK
jgi:hypothetical protein